MPLDASIILGAKPVQLRSPLDTASKALTLRKLSMGLEQDRLLKEAAAANTIKNPDGTTTLNMKSFVDAVSQKSPLVGFKLKGELAKADQGAQAAKIKGFEAAAKQAEVWGQYMSPVKTVEDYYAQRQKLADAGFGEQVQRMKDFQPGQEAELGKYISDGLMQAQSVKDQTANMLRQQGIKATLRGQDIRHSDSVASRAVQIQRNALMAGDLSAKLQQAQERIDETVLKNDEDAFQKNQARLDKEAAVEKKITDERNLDARMLLTHVANVKNMQATADKLLDPANQSALWRATGPLSDKLLTVSPKTAGIEELAHSFETQAAKDIVDELRSGKTGSTGMGRITQLEFQRFGGAKTPLHLRQGYDSYVNSVRERRAMGDVSLNNMFRSFREEHGAEALEPLVQQYSRQFKVKAATMATVEKTAAGSNTPVSKVMDLMKSDGYTVVDE